MKKKDATTFTVDTLLYLVWGDRVQITFFPARSRVGNTVCMLPWEQVLKAFDPKCAVRVRVCES